MSVAAQRVGLTHRQHQCFMAADAYIREHKCSPSMEDLRVALNLSSRGYVVRLVAALQERGYVTVMPNKGRSLAIVRDEPQYELPPAIEDALRAHCKATGDDPADVVADAVSLHLDALAGPHAECAT